MQNKHLFHHQTESHMQTNISVDAGFSFKLLALGSRLGRAVEFCFGEDILNHHSNAPWHCSLSKG